MEVGRGIAALLIETSVMFLCNSGKRMKVFHIQAVFHVVLTREERDICEVCKLISCCMLGKLMYSKA